MRKATSFVLAAVIAGAATTGHAGLLSSIRDKVTGANQPVEVEVREGKASDAPANAKAQPTPDPAKVKEGARKLSRQLATEKLPRDLFSRYAGKWSGNFWVYTIDGRLEQTSKSTIVFEPQGGGTMKMTTFYYDQISKAFVTGETSTYRIEGDTVVVETDRGKGKFERQVGRFNDGQLFFKSEIKDGVQHTRERVDGKRLLMDGFGVYGSLKGTDQHILIGRYLKEN